MAGPGFSETSIFTTPNQLHIPQFAIAHNEITTYNDGRWGLHEYSRWPQEYDRAYIHVACIPRKGARCAPASEVVWRTWQMDDWEIDACGVARLGMLKRSLVHELQRAADDAIEGVYACRRDCVQTNEVVSLLVLCVRQCLDRLRLLPSERSVVISLAAHVQRLVLELAGVQLYLQEVIDRVTSKRDYRLDILDVVGAYTADASSAQLLHRVGIPVWFQQHLTPMVRFWSVAMLTTLPICFSSIPSYPRLVLALRDLSGALNAPGEWQRVMNAIVRRQLCASRLPELIVADDTDSDDDVSNKRARLEAQWTHGWDSAIGESRPTLVVQNPRHARTLPHVLPIAPRGIVEGKRVPSTRSRKKLPASSRATSSRASFTMNPFRQHYASELLTDVDAWKKALETISPLPQPSKSVKYFLPPPWLLDHLRGYSASADKLSRYLHHWLAIRKFCRIRLFDRTISGRPLTISEWRDALWGDYSLDPSDDGVSQGPRSPSGGSDRLKRRHQVKQSLRQLFGNVAALPSYDPASRPQFGGIPVSRESASSDVGVRSRVVWELHESNWRCELLALDAVMVGSTEWPETLRWIREAHISEVWGPPRSGVNVAPDVDEPPAICWTNAADDEWTQARGHLRAFVDLLSRWKTCPPDLQLPPGHVESCDRGEYGRIQSQAVDFYVRTFVNVFERLPTPPVRPPLPSEAIRRPTDT